MKPLSSIGLIFLWLLMSGSFAGTSQPHTAVAGQRPDIMPDNEQCRAAALQSGDLPAVGDGDLILRGELLSATNRPLAGYVVQLRAMTQLIDETGTDAEGFFAFSHLPVGSYTLVVRHTDGEPVELSPASASTIDLEDTHEAFAVLYAATIADPDVSTRSHITPAQAGAISGTVTAADTGEPLANVRVRVTAAVRSPFFSNIVFTDASGTYTMTNLSAGDYAVEFDPQNPLTDGDPVEVYLAEYYNNQLNKDTVDLVRVPASGTITDIDAALTRGSRISGTVTAADDGAPLQYVTVEVTTADDEYIGNFRTDAAGNYMTPGLPTGSYMVEFMPATFRPSRVYVGEYYNDQMIRDAADPIAVTAGTDVSAINAELARGTQISGRVTDADTAEPLRDVDVIVYNYCSRERITITKTDSGGSYTTPGLPSGSYGVRFEPRSLGGSSAYMSATYADQSSAPAGGRIDTTAPTDVNDIDAQLRRGGAITGIVIAADTGDPLDNVSVRASSADTGTVATGETNNAGAYTIEGLPSGEYTVYFNTVNSLDIAENYVSTFYNNQATRETADTVSVTAPNTTDTIDAVLTRGSAINGTVTAADTGITLDDVVVNVRDPDGNFLRVESVASDGNYRVFGLPSGSYKVEFDAVKSSRAFTVFPVNDAFAYLDEYYRGQSAIGTADLVTITAPNDLNNIDAELERGGQISGRVTAADTGDPLKNVEVFIEGVAEPVTTDEDGRYITPGLPSGDYWIWFFTRSNDLNYIGELYDNATLLNNADPVSVTAPTITRNIDGSLSPAGSITGVVTDAGTGEPLVSISVEAECERPDGAILVLDGETNARGEYVLTGLPTSTCTVRFVELFNPCVDLASEYYNDQPFVDMATPVDVTAPNTTSNINAALNVGGSISGIVTAEDSGLGLDRVAVRAYSPSGDEVSSSATADDGSYTISNLPPGSYVIEFAPIVGPSYAYIRKFYNNKPSQTAADTVTVTANTETDGINAVLARGGQISGTITGGVTDVGVNAVLARGGQISGTITGEVTDAWVNVEVIVYDRAGNQVASVNSEFGTGNYLTPGLPSGDYVIQFVPENAGRGYISEFYNNKRTLAAADPVTVTARSVTSRIDAAIDVGFTVYLPLTTR